ncbi:MAG: hypothetical protein KKE50_06605, partial [Nanoarchaeota archaeon]|nr:hypothetical protein [Nanoarchaeota archaeon]
IKITSNNIFVNSTLDSGFNTTANITIKGLSTGNPQALVDWDDDGDYEICPLSVCTNLSYSGGVFVFNVTHFTSYKAQEFNTPPNSSIVYINSTDGTNYTNRNLNCYTTLYDADGNNMNVSVKWYKNQGENLSINYNNSYSNGLFNAVLGSGNTTKHENWSCSIRVYDGQYYSNWSNSSSLEIRNSLPVVTLLSPESGNITINRTPEFSWSASDADSDDLTYEINITSSSFTDDDRYLADILSLSYVPSSDLKYLSDNGYYYTWRVRATDGDYGDWTDSNTINITSYVSISLLTDSVNFGITNMSEEKNTTQDNPAPMIINNAGNVLVNVSVNATELWESESQPTERFIGKIRSYFGNASWANTTWFRIPSLTGAVSIIDRLQYKDTNDSVKFDISVKVPDAEPPGNKSSTINFLARLAE